MKTIRLLQDVIGGNGEPLKEGSLHSLNDASANHWLNRGLAVEVEEPVAQAQIVSDNPQPSTTLTVSRREKRKGVNK
jgi:hypothetical protein